MFCLLKMSDGWITKDGWMDGWMGHGVVLGDARKRVSRGQGLTHESSWHACVIIGGVLVLTRN